MANHGHVILAERPDADAVTAVAKEVLAKFSGLEMDYEPEGGWPRGGTGPTWMIPLEVDGDKVWDSVLFWLDEMYDSKKPCIEFRHGHSSHVAWWIEAEFMNEFARRFGGTIDDDGPREILPAFATFREHWAATRPDPEIPDWVFDGLPERLMRYVG